MEMCPKAQYGETVLKDGDSVGSSVLWEVVELIPKKDEWNRALCERHGEDKKKFSATVAICGLGGLGSNVAISLAVPVLEH